MNEEKIPDWRREEFDEIKTAELKTARAWAIKESLRRFWNYHYPKNAQKYFKRWYFWATHSRLKPVIQAAKTLKRHGSTSTMSVTGQHHYILYDPRKTVKGLF